MTDKPLDITAELVRSLPGAASGRRDGERGSRAGVEARRGDADPERLYRRYQAETAAVGDPATAIRYLKRAAAAGSNPARVGLGNRYRRGDGVPLDLVAAWNQYVAAAREGDLEAMTNIGVMYDQGMTVPADPVRACCCYRYAAERGFAAAQYNLAIMLAEGLGTERDREEACFWFDQAAAQGHRQAGEARDWLQAMMEQSS